jgi:hypothetical protein
MLEYTSRFERLELKYLVDESMAQRIRQDIRAYCAADPHNKALSGDFGRAPGYPINSCYLDSPSLAFHAAKERGDANRLKLRVRTYSSTSPASLEIKRRRSAVIAKTRVIVDRNRVEEAIAGDLDVKGMAERDSSILAEFSLIAAKCGARPTLMVSYWREAFESRVDAYARVTFDRKVRALEDPTWCLEPRKEAWNSFNDYWKAHGVDNPVVLELKCETVPPIWMVDLIRKYHLTQTSFSKYSTGVGLCRLNGGLGRGSSTRSLKALG